MEKNVPPHKMRYGAIVAARTGSTRLPGKALLPLNGLPMIVYLLNRIRPSKLVDEIVFATTILEEDDRLADIVRKEGFSVMRGANEDVVARYADCAEHYGYDYVVRITGDCPFVDAETLDFCIAKCLEFDDFDLASTKGCFPVGIDYEIFRAKVIAKLHKSGKLTQEEREHVTLHLYNNSEVFRIQRIRPPNKWKTERKFTVDTREDYYFAAALAIRLSSLHAGQKEIIETSERVLILSS